MSSPRLSFVVPVYKPDAAIFEKALKSIKEQSLKDIEVIVVFDGRDDIAYATATRVLSGVQFPTQFIVNEHGGACAARNRGGQEAKGEFVVFWDCDCVIEPHAAQAWCDAFDKYKSAAFIYSGYRFLGERGGIASEPFDPWTLRVRNYVSSCFPVRREFMAQWDTSLESLQDWDFWLSVVEKGGSGRFIPGYAFATAYPTPESISGKGCTPEVWLERLDKVKAKHGIPIRKVCVSAIGNKVEGVRLAKLLDADYQDIPNDKPNHYESIVKVGFSLTTNGEAHGFVFRDLDTRKVLFWTSDNILEIYHRVSLNDIRKTANSLNRICFKQYVEDKPSCEMMKAAGFNVEVMPLPIVNSDATPALPSKPKWLVETSEQYGACFVALERSLPDIDLEVPNAAVNVEDYTGILHFMPDKSMTQTVKRGLLTGRHIISNIQQPFTGYVNDDTSPDSFIPQLVEKIRATSKKPSNQVARAYYERELTPNRLMEVLK